MKYFEGSCGKSFGQWCVLVWTDSLNLKYFHGGVLELSLLSSAVPTVSRNVGRLSLRGNVGRRSNVSGSLRDLNVSGNNGG